MTTKENIWLASQNEQAQYCLVFRSQPNAWLLVIMTAVENMIRFKCPCKSPNFSWINFKHSSVFINFANHLRKLSNDRYIWLKSPVKAAVKPKHQVNNVYILCHSLSSSSWDNLSICKLCCCYCQQAAADTATCHSDDSRARTHKLVARIVHRLQYTGSLAWSLFSVHLINSYGFNGFL